MKMKASGIAFRIKYDIINNLKARSGRPHPVICTAYAIHKYADYEHI